MELSAIRAPRFNSVNIGISITELLVISLSLRDTRVSGTDNITF